MPSCWLIRCSSFHAQRATMHLHASMPCLAFMPVLLHCCLRYLCVWQRIGCNSSIQFLSIPRRGHHCLAGACRYQVWDAYSHSQVDLTSLTVVPHITYTSATTQSSADVSSNIHVMWCGSGPFHNLHCLPSYVFLLRYQTITTSDHEYMQRIGSCCLVTWYQNQIIASDNAIQTAQAASFKLL